MSTQTLQLLSQSHWLADGSQTVWNFSFTGGYINPTHVRAYTKTPAGVRTELVINYDTDLVGPFQLLITPAVAAGDTLVIYRDSSNGGLPLVDFADGAALDEKSLDVVAKQSVFVSAETEDFLGVTTEADLVALGVAAAAAAGAAQASAINADISADMAAADRTFAEVASNAAAGYATNAFNSATNAAAAAASAVSTFQARMANAGLVTDGDALLAVKRVITNAVASTVHDWIEGTTLNLQRDFGVVADNVTDQTAKVILAINAAKTRLPCTLELPRGMIYCATSIGNIAIEGLTIKANAKKESGFRFGHAGVALLADAFASGSPSDPYIHLNLTDFTVEGNSATTHIFQAQGITRSRINLNLKNANTASGIAAHLKGVQLMEELSITCSVDYNAMTSVPFEGFRIEAGTRAGVSVGNSSNNRIHLRLSGLGINARFAAADQSIVTGATESATQYGLLVAPASRYNLFMGVGFENPAASSAAVNDSGISSIYHACYCDKNFILGGSLATVLGGFYERIEIQAGAVKNSVRKVNLNNWRTGTGGFFDSGTATDWKDLKGTTLTATFATSVMTVTATAAAQGPLAVGQTVVATGVAPGTTITSFGTYTVASGVGTVNLSTSPGTLGSRAVQTDGYIYPYAARTGITVTASPFVWTNTTGQYVEVIIQTGTVTQMRILRGTDQWLVPPGIPGKHLVAPTDSLEVSYSVSPGMSYVPHNGFQG